MFQGRISCMIYVFLTSLFVLSESRQNSDDDVIINPTEVYFGFSFVRKIFKQDRQAVRPIDQKHLKNNKDESYF